MSSRLRIGTIESKTNQASGLNFEFLSQNNIVKT
jgi:hypothetical protein